MDGSGAGFEEQEARRMVMMNDRDLILSETRRTRAQAAWVLRELMTASASCEAALAAESRADLARSITGQSSLEVTIAETRKVIDSLDRAIDAAERDLDTEDRGVFGGCEGLEAVVVAGRLALAGRVVA